LRFETGIPASTADVLIVDGTTYFHAEGDSPLARILGRAETPWVSVPSAGRAFEIDPARAAEVLEQLRGSVAVAVEEGGTAVRRGDTVRLYHFRGTGRRGTRFRGSAEVGAEDDLLRSISIEGDGPLEGSMSLVFEEFGVDVAALAPPPDQVTAVGN
jgi:hypothetical protein